MGRTIVEELEEESESATDPTLVMLEAVGKARKVFERGYADLKSKSLKEERVMLLEAWKAVEDMLPADANQKSKVESMMPRVVKKRRKVDEDGSMEECMWLFSRCLQRTYIHPETPCADFDLIFQDDEQEKNPASFKLLQMAHAWKQKQQKQQEESTKVTQEAATGESTEAGVEEES